MARDTRPLLIRCVPPDRMSAALAERFATLLAKVSFEITEPNHETVRKIVTVVAARRWVKGGNKVWWYS